jgi:zinc protease
MNTEPQKGRIKFFFRTWLCLVLFLVLLPAIGRHGVLQAKSPPRIERIVLPNNLVLLISEEHSLPFVILEMLVDAGSRRDPSGSEGLAHLTAQSLLLGTSRMTSAQVNRAIDFLGASLGTSTSRDYAILRLQVLKKDLDVGLGLFMQSLSSPAFPDAEIQKLKKRIVGEIQASEEQPLVLADRVFQKTLFPNSPYGHAVEGTPESVQPLKRDDVDAFWRSFYRPNNAVLAIVGDITVAEVREKIIPLLTGLEKGTIPEVVIKGDHTQGPKEARVDRKISQATVIMGNGGPKRGDPDYYAAVLMNYIVGGDNLQSRLSSEIRVKRGLAYSVISQLEPGKLQGSFQIILQTKKASAPESISLAKGQMELMRKQPVSDRSLREAKQYLTGSFPLRFDTQSELAEILTRIEFYGLGLDYLDKYPSLIRSVTKEDVLQASRRYLHPDQAIMVIVGDMDKGSDTESISTNFR